MNKKTTLKSINPRDLGFSNRIKIAQDKNKNYYIVKNIKSRIIMKDGIKIKKIVEHIKKQKKTMVHLATTAPICGKTKEYLSVENIIVVDKYIVK